MMVKVTGVIDEEGLWILIVIIIQCHGANRGGEKIALQESKPQNCIPTFF
jgi:hypothetical protein